MLSVRLVAAAGFAAIAAASAARAEDAARADAPRPDEMIRLASAEVDEVWIRAGGAGLERFNAVYLHPVAVSYKHRDPDVVLDDEQLAEMDEIVREEVAESLSDGGFAIADAPGPGVLEIRAELAEMDINAASFNQRPGVRTFVRNVGSMTLVAALRDSETGANLVLVRDHVQGHENRFSIVTASTYRAEFRGAVSDWSDLLRARLDDARLAETGSY
jgi:hypothetical protein